MRENLCNHLSFSHFQVGTHHNHLLHHFTSPFSQKKRMHNCTLFTSKHMPSLVFYSILGYVMLYNLIIHLL